MCCPDCVAEQRNKVWNFPFPSPSHPHPRTINCRHIVWCRFTHFKLLLLPDMLPSPLLTFPQWAKFACTLEAIFFCLLPALLASSRVMLKFQKGMIRRVFSPFSLSQATSVSHHTAPLPGVGSDEIRSSVSKCFFKLKMSISSDEKCASRCPLPLTPNHRR